MPRTMLIAVIFVCFASTALAATFAQTVSDATGPAAALGVAAAYFTTGELGKQNASRMADALLLSVGTAELLKPNLTVNDNRWDHSFPSGHTALAFATASSLGKIHPKQKWLYYAGAALVGWSRVETGAHTWTDVLGGAALGTAAGNLSMSSQNGLMLGRIYKF